MLSVETMVAFFVASILLGLAPGPDNIFVMTQSALYGRTTGLITLMGLCTGLIVHTVAVASGVAVIFQSSALAFSFLKIVGACYLLYLAWQAFRTCAGDYSSSAVGIKSYRQLYMRGIVMNITNPKVSIFFLAFLPQFAEPSRGPVILQLLILGGLFIVATLVVFGGIAFLAGWLGEALKRSPRIQQVLNKVAGAIFLGLALKLATTER
jgi:threonine/homoserine/homoserine lactone efflux protein